MRHHHPEIVTLRSGRGGTGDAKGVLALTGILVLSGIRGWRIGGYPFIGLEVWLVAILSLGAVRKLLGRGEEFRLNFGLVATLLLFAVALLFSMLEAANHGYFRPDESVKHASRLLVSATIVFVLIELTRGQESLRVAERSLLVTAVLISALFVWDVANGLPPSRYTGGFADPNYFASYLMLLFFPVLGWVESESRRAGQRIAGTLLLGVLVVQVALTFSRSGALALVSGLLVFAVLGSLIRGPRLALRTLTKSVVGVLILVVGSVSLQTRAPSFFDNAVVRWGIERLTLESGRVWQLRAGLEAIVQNPFTGLGLGQSRFILTEFSPDVSGQQYSNVVHNLYLEVLLASGIPAFLIFVGILFIGLKATRRMYLASKSGLLPAEDQSFIVGWIAALTSFFVMTMTLDLLTVRHAAVAFGLTVGLGMCRPIVNSALDRGR